VYRCIFVVVASSGALQDIVNVVDDDDDDDDNGNGNDNGNDDGARVLIGGRSGRSLLFCPARMGTQRRKR
jgi:hypothetical protein